MTKRPAIAALLHEGATYRQVRAVLGGGSPNVISDVRKTEAIPVPERTKYRRSVEETYALYAEPFGDGHARWAGPWAGRMPQICHPGRNGRKESALRVAFRMRHGRDAEGYVRPGCGVHQCVASGHLTDRVLRARLKNPSEVQA